MRSSAHCIRRQGLVARKPALAHTYIKGRKMFCASCLFLFLPRHKHQDRALYTIVSEMILPLNLIVLLLPVYSLVWQVGASSVFPTQNDILQTLVIPCSAVILQ